MSFKCGFIGIIGRANAGKSTLINALVHEKVAIATYKAQTTRNVIRGILTSDDYQMIFMDTPGIHKAKSTLGREMNRAAFNTMHGVDVIYYIVDGTKKFNQGDEFIIRSLKNNNDIPVILLVNKLDKLHASDKLDALEDWNSRMDFAEVLPISALQGKNLDMLLDVTLQYLPEMPAIYPKDMVTDAPESFLISEIIREKTLFCLDKEVPHSIAVVTESVEYKKDVMVISALICVERDSQKGIVIGKGGEMLKKISSEARKELEDRFGQKVYLTTFVRVEENWPDKLRKLQDLGISEKKEYE